MSAFDPADYVPLAQVAPAVVAAFGPIPIVNSPYRKIVAGVSDARIPARRVGGRWYIARADLPLVAAFLGIPSAIAPASDKAA